MSFHRVKEVYRLEELEKIFVRYDQRKWSFKLMLGKPHFLYFSRLEMKVTKSSGGVPRLSYTGRDDRHFLPTGLYIIKTVSGTCLSHLLLLLSPVGCQSLQVLFKLPSIINCNVRVLPSEPWTMAYSKNSMKKFFFNKLTKESTYDMPPNAAAPFQYVSFFWVFHVTCFCANDMCWSGSFFALSSVFAMLSASSGPGWKVWSSMIRRRGWTPRNYPKMMSCPSYTRTTSPETPAELLNFTCWNPERFHYNIEDRDWSALLFS